MCPSAAALTLARPFFVVAQLPHRPGVVSAEPGIAADGGGAFWVIAQGFDPAQAGPVTGGVAPVWRSTDGGRAYRAVKSPIDLTTKRALPFAGSDVDIAAAPVRNHQGTFTVYAVTQYFSTQNTANMALAFSKDDAHHWVTVPLGSPTVLVDRPWLAASGACDVYVSYYATDGEPFVTGQSIGTGLYVKHVNVCARSLPTLKPVEPIAKSVAPMTVYEGGGKPAVRGKHVYVPLSRCRGNVVRSTRPWSCAKGTEILVAKSADEGQTWHDTAVITTLPSGNLPLWNTQVAVAAGRIYAAWFDQHDAFLSVSSDDGRTWSAPQQLNYEPSAAIFPQLAAAGDSVVVTWYQANRDGDVESDAAMGKPGVASSARWQVWLARSSNGGVGVSGTPIGDAVHFGAECVHGGYCDSLPNGDDRVPLLDDFGIALNPVTGRASIAFTSDQPGGGINHVHSWYATETS